MTTTAAFESVVFAGGGNRCVWQLGFWEAASGVLGIAPRSAAAVSGGAAVATLIFAGRGREGLETFKALTGENARNIYPVGALRRRARLFPHQGIYEALMRASIDEAALAQLHAGPEVRVLLARPPRWLGARSSALLAAFAYQAERRLRNPAHARSGQRVGFRPEVVSTRACETPEALVELVMQSSCSPPLTPILKRGHKPVLDGSIVDCTPVLALDEADRAGGGMLVLLTRRHASTPRVPGRVYVQPSEPPPILMYDYTNPEGLQATFDLGLRDGEVFARAFEAGLLEALDDEVTEAPGRGWWRRAV